MRIGVKSASVSSSLYGVWKISEMHYHVQVQFILIHFVDIVVYQW